MSDDVRAAADRLRRAYALVRPGVRLDEEIRDAVYPGHIASDVSALMGRDQGITSNAYLRLTDPAPLTEELLRGFGFWRDGEFMISRRGENAFLSVRGVGEGNAEWVFGFRHRGFSHDIPFSVAPRTVGELRQLAARVGVELKGDGE